jgi:hypothetical protein
MDEDANKFLTKEIFIRNLFLLKGVPLISPSITNVRRELNFCHSSNWAPLFVQPPLLVLSCLYWYIAASIGT